MSYITQGLWICREAGGILKWTKNSRYPIQYPKNVDVIQIMYEKIWQMLQSFVHPLCNIRKLNWRIKLEIMVQWEGKVNRIVASHENCHFIIPFLWCNKKEIPQNKYSLLMELQILILEIKIFDWSNSFDLFGDRFGCNAMCAPFPNLPRNHLQPIRQLCNVTKVRKFSTIPI